MMVAVGSRNPCKVGAVEQTLAGDPAYDRLGASPQVRGYSVASEVSEQPLTMNETLSGAKCRARAALQAAAEAGEPAVLAFGIESGLFEVDGSLYDICAVAVLAEGAPERYQVGWSCSFRLPDGITERIRLGDDLSQACVATGLTGDAEIGMHQGAIGILSKGRITRQAYTVQAVTSAMIGIEMESLYVTSG